MARRKDKKPKDKKPSKAREMIINLFTLLVFGGIILAGLRFFEPETYYSITLAMDFSGKKGDSKSERQRISQINLLPISDEKKRILMNHTIFLDASTTMVQLAVGEPKYRAAPVMNDQGVTVDRWVYHFNDDYRPTVLQFENKVLKNAYKISEHRLAGQPEATYSLPPEATKDAPAPAPQQRATQ